MNLESLVSRVIGKGNAVFEESIIELLDEKVSERSEVRFVGSLVKSQQTNPSTTNVFVMTFERGFEIFFSGKGDVLFYRLFGEVLSQNKYRVNFPSSMSEFANKELRTTIVNEAIYICYMEKNGANVTGDAFNISYVFDLDYEPAFYEVTGTSPNSAIARTLLETSKVSTLWF